VQVSSVYMNIQIMTELNGEIVLWLIKCHENERISLK
jgi:hypothetical protein